MKSIDVSIFRIAVNFYQCAQFKELRNKGFHLVSILLIKPWIQEYSVIKYSTQYLFILCCESKYSVYIIVKHILKSSSKCYRILNVCLTILRTFATQKMKFSITDFVSKCDQSHRKLRIWSHLLKKSVMENFIFSTMLNSL